MKKKPLPKIKPNTRPSTLLRYARQVLIDRGWLKGKFAEEVTATDEDGEVVFKYQDGAVCALGALNLLVTGNPSKAPAFDDDLRQLRVNAAQKLLEVVGTHVP